MVSGTAMAWAAGRMGVLDCAEEVEGTIRRGRGEADVKTHRECVERFL